MARFGQESRARLKLAHPLLQKLMKEAIKEFDFTILQSMRGRADQEMAFKLGHTKVHFGNSAHNWYPSIALDVAPWPVNWKNLKPFYNLSKVILPIAREMKIPIRWGGDWDSDGDSTDQKFMDLPHYELDPWRKWSKKSKLFEGK
jgi:peptidoglycan LD-endopeptidase CwlK